MKGSARRSDKAAHVEQPALLDQKSAGGPAHEGRENRYRLLTNRNNLLNILSSGWIVPTACYQNYYDDAGRYARDGIVLLRNDPSEELGLHMVGSDPSVFPVVLDVDVSGLDGKVAVIDPDYGVVLANMSGAGMPLALVCRGMLPASRVVTVHFRSDEDLQEHRVREYENVPGDATDMFVSPDVFQGTDVSPERLAQALDEANGLIAPVDKTLIRHAASLGGSLLMLAATMRVVHGLPLSVLSAPLNALGHLEHAVPDLPAVESYTREEVLERCMSILPSFLSGHSHQEPQSDGWNERVVELLGDALQEPVSDESASIVLFLTACAVLAETEHEDYYNRGVLEDIRKYFVEMLPGIPASSEDNSARSASSDYMALLDAIRGVLDATLDVADFSPAAGPVPVGLLRFLQRSSPSGVMTWIDERPGPDDLAIAVAALLAGILHRRERVPVDILPGDSLVRCVDERVCWHVNRVAAGLLPVEGVHELESETVEADGRSVRVLKWNGEIIMSQPVQSSPASPEATGSRDARSTGVEAPGARRDVEVSGERIRGMLLSSDLRPGRVRDACVRLCSDAGWDDCLTTVLTLEKPDIYMRTAPDNRGVELRIPGTIRPPTLDLRDREFKARLNSTSAADVSAQTWADVALMMGITRSQDMQPEQEAARPAGAGSASGRSRTRERRKPADEE